jgi:hypothetical protein
LKTPKVTAKSSLVELKAFRGLHTIRLLYRGIRRELRLPVLVGISRKCLPVAVEGFTR